MFQSISWGQYWTFVVSLSVGYYLLVCLFYFKIPGKRLSTTEFKNSLRSPQIEEMVVQACMDEINAFFENQKKTKPVKTEIITALNAILKKYPLLNTSSYKDPLSGLITVERESSCSIHLGADEFKGVRSDGG